MSSTRHKPIIAVSVTGTEAGQDNQVLLGYVHPPTVNNISVHSLYDDSDIRFWMPYGQNGGKR